MDPEIFAEIIKQLDILSYRASYPESEYDIEAAADARVESNRQFLNGVVEGVDIISAYSLIRQTASTALYYGADSERDNPPLVARDADDNLLIMNPETGVLEIVKINDELVKWSDFVNTLEDSVNRLKQPLLNQAGEFFEQSSGELLSTLNEFLDKKDMAPEDHLFISNIKAKLFDKDGNTKEISEEDILAIGESMSRYPESLLESYPELFEALNGNDFIVKTRCYYNVEVGMTDGIYKLRRVESLPADYGVVLDAKAIVVSNDELGEIRPSFGSDASSLIQKLGITG